MGKLHGSGCTRPPLTVAVALLASSEHRWSADELHDEIRGFLGERTDWPAALEFLDTGRGDLLLTMDRLGGRRAWRRRFGMRVRPGGGRLTEEQAERVIRHFLNARPDWPTWAELHAAGLDQVVCFCGPGPAAWQARFGYGRNSSQTWTPDLIRAQLAEFVADRADWPTQREFRGSGRKGLLDAVYNHGGSAHWADQFGLTPRPHGRNGSRAAARH